MKTDIRNREDIVRLVNLFYEKVKMDKTIGFLFTEVARIDWNKHLPIMYDFWENILFSTANFDGNPILKHKELNEKSKLDKKHFQHWNKLFLKTVDELFEGSKAEEIKIRALNISNVMMFKALS